MSKDTGRTRSGHPYRFEAAVLLLFLAALASTTPTDAGTPADRGTSDEQAACTPDVFRLCAGDIPDETAILACLRQNAGRLGSDCRRVLDPAPVAHRRAPTSINASNSPRPPRGGIETAKH